MTVTVEVAIPDEVLNGQNDDVARRILEEFALAGFKSGQLSVAQLQRILGCGRRMQVHDFLASRGVTWFDYPADDSERERKLLRQLLP
jgi:hypothetical protein